MTTGAPAAAEAPWRFKLQSAIGLFISSLVAGTGFVLIYFDFRNSSELKAYHSAGSCAAPADALSGEGCRYTGAATVTASTGQPVVSISVIFCGLPGRIFTTTFSDIDEPNPASAVTGATETAELWNGRVTTFADVTTLDNPGKLPMNLAPGGWIIVLFGLIPGAFCIVYVRRAWQR